jgi:hypothetical protein
MRRACQTLVVCVAAVAGATVSAAEPLTSATYDTQLREWMAQKLQSEFQAHGNKAAPWAADLATFYPAFTKNLVGQFADEAEAERLDAQAAALAKAGCDDPVFLACQARIGIARKRLRQAEIALRPLSATIAAAGYPPFCSFLPLLWHRRAALESGVNRPPPPEFAATAIAAATDPAFAGDGRLIYVRSVLPEDRAVYALAAERFAKPDSGVDPWIKALVIGRAEIGKGWEARGAGWAGDVQPEGWEKFAEHLARAREQLTKAHELHPEYPDAAAEMITVSLGDRSDEERLWFDRAVEAQFDHEPAYRQLGVTALLPRWGGSHEQMLEFGRHCLASGRFDTFVPAFILDVALAIGEELPDRRDAFAMPGVYEDCLRAMNGYLKQPRPPATVHLWKSRLAILHWATGRYAEAAQVLDELGDELAPRALAEFKAKRDDVVGEARLFGGPHADDVEAAEEWIAENKVDEALAAYEKIAERDDIPPGGRRLLASRIAAMKTAAALERYEWVDLQPPPDLAGWRVVAGDWKVDKDGTVVGSTPGQGRFKIVCEANLGEDVEFTLECDLGGRPGREPVLDRFNIMAGHDEDERRAVAVQVGGSAHTVWLTNGFTNENFQAARVQTRNLSTLRVILWDGKATVFVNDQKVFDKVAVPAEWLGGGGLAVSEYSPGPPMQMRMRKLRARKLEKAPADF